MDEARAREAIAQVCAWLGQVRAQNLVEPDEFGYVGETKAADLARELARELLKAADANGLGGCRLCQG